MAKDPIFMESVKSKSAISAIEVAGLKSIQAKQSMEIRPLTVLAGANSSGKSSMMQSILLLKQTLEAPYDPGALLIRGPNADFTSTDQLLFHATGKSSSQRILFGIRTTHGDQAEITFSKNKKKGSSPFEIVSQESKVEGKRVFLKNPTVDDAFDNPHFWEYTHGWPKEYRKNISSRIVRNRCFLEAELSFQSEANLSHLIGINPVSHFVELITHIIHLPGLRGNPERTYSMSSIGKKFSGRFDNYVASVLSSWGRNSDSLLGELGDNLSVLGLTWKVEARTLNDTEVELRVGRLRKSTRGGGKDLVNIADVGFGVSQVLPVAVSLLVAEPGQLVYIEQPEIHLHPKAQAAMAKLLVDAANRGVRVVVETHSSLLLLGIQSLVAENVIDPKKVIFHWFERDDLTGATTIRSADIDEAGRFGDWPEDFADTSLEAESRYLDAAEARLANRESL